METKRYVFIDANLEEFNRVNQTKISDKDVEGDGNDENEDLLLR